MTYDRFAELWDATYEPRFRIDEAIFERNLVRDSLICVTVDRAEGFAVLKSGRTEYGGDTTAFNLSALAYATPEAGARVLREIIGKAKELGAARISFGQDSDHIWPGVPVDHPFLTAVLAVDGFKFGGEVVDLERDLVGYQVRDTGSLESEFRVATAADELGLISYFNREFPGRWKFDVMQQFSADPKRVFVWVSDGAIEGHALIQDSSTDHPIGGAIWRRDLGANWGALGSIGVSAALRGGGNGGRLLDGALMELSRRGCRTTIIDWTGLAEFYGKYGFKVTRRYQSASLHL